MCESALKHNLQTTIILMLKDLFATSLYFQLSFRCKKQHKVARGYVALNQDLLNNQYLAWTDGSLAPRLFPLRPAVAPLTFVRILFQGSVATNSNVNTE